MLSNFVKENNIGKLSINVSLKTKTTFRIGGICKYFLEVNSILSLKKIIKFCNEFSVKYFIIGNGSNLLISDEYYDCLFITLKKINKYYSLPDNRYFVEAGVNAICFGRKMVKKGFLDALHLAVIPGLIGGLIYMNASAFRHSMKDIVVKIVYMDKNGVISSISNDFGFGYRTSFFQNRDYIIIGSILKFNESSNEAYQKLERYWKIKKDTQPITSFNAGSVFRNLENVNVWELIDKTGFRGYTVGDAMVSEKHTNFFINKKNATFNDMYSLIYFVKRKVEYLHNVKLDLEIKIITKDFICPCQFKKNE